MNTNAELATRSGISLSVRAATEADETALSAFFDAVSDDDRRFVFPLANTSATNSSTS